MGGSIEVLGSSDGSTYDIGCSNVPSADCSKLALSAGANFLKVSVNGMAVFDRLAARDAVGVDRDAAEAACGQAGASTIHFTGE